MSLRSEILDIVEAGPGAIEGEALPDAVRRYGNFRAYEMAHNLATLPGCIVCDAAPVIRIDLKWQLVCSAGCGVHIEGDLDDTMRRWAERPTAEDLK